MDAEQHVLLVIQTANAVEPVIENFEAVHPEDNRLRKAIEAARAWAAGHFSVPQARKVAFAAHAAARQADTKAAMFAARAAGHVAATAHVASHAKHALAYAAKAVSADGRT